MQLTFATYYRLILLFVGSQAARDSVTSIKKHYSFYFTVSSAIFTLAIAFFVI